MNTMFAETMKKLRTERGLSQIGLGKQMSVNNSTVTRWENGTRLPDAAMIARLSKVLDVDVATLLSAAVGSDESTNVILVDDSRVILADGLAVLEKVLPHATITGFIRPQEAIEYVRTNRVALAILDIELGTASGLDLSRTLLEINPRMNIVFLTAYPDYAVDAWKTEASGFMLKPLTPESVKEQLNKLRYPFFWEAAAYDDEQYGSCQFCHCGKRIRDLRSGSPPDRFPPPDEPGKPQLSDLFPAAGGLHGFGHDMPACRYDAPVKDHAVYQLSVLVPADPGDYPVSASLRREKLETQPAVCAGHRPLGGLLCAAGNHTVYHLYLLLHT